MATWVTQAEYAKHRGVSRQAVHKALRAGRIVVGEDGKIDQEAADAAWKGNSSPQMQPGSLNGGAGQPRQRESVGDSSALSYAQARSVREGWQARLARLEYEERVGVLLNRDEVKVAVFNKDRRVRDLLLALPDRVTPLIATTPEEQVTIYAILQDEVLRALKELAGDFGRSPDTGNVGGGLPAPALANGSRVG